MKTINCYIDNQGVIRYVERMPEQIILFRGKPGNDTAGKFYKLALEKAKQDSVPFEDQDAVREIIWQQPTGMGIYTPDNFYSFQFDGEVEIIDAKIARVFSTGDKHKHMPLRGNVARLIPKPEPVESLEDIIERWKSKFTITRK